MALLKALVFLQVALRNHVLEVVRFMKLQAVPSSVRA